jgi:hypothetical protein
VNPFRTIERTALKGSLRLARLPLDTAIRFLPGNGEGPSGRAKLAVDQVDATLLTAAGTLLRDRDVTDEAQRKLAAVRERRRATELRTQAERAGAKADEKLERRTRQAESQREKAAKRAQSRRREADERRQERIERAAKIENQRLNSSQQAAERAAEAIEQREPRARLDALKEKERALGVQEEALTAADEARRLAEAAARAKAERKSED